MPKQLKRAISACEIAVEDCGDIAQCMTCEASNLLRRAFGLRQTSDGRAPQIVEMKIDDTGCPRSFAPRVSEPIVRPWPPPSVREDYRPESRHLSQHCLQPCRHWHLHLTAVLRLREADSIAVVSAPGQLKQIALALTCFGREHERPLQVHRRCSHECYDVMVQTAPTAGRMLSGIPIAIETG